MTAQGIRRNFSQWRDDGGRVFTNCQLDNKIKENV